MRPETLRETELRIKQERRAAIAEQKQKEQELWRAVKAAKDREIRERKKLEELTRKYGPAQL